MGDEAWSYRVSFLDHQSDCESPLSPCAEIQSFAGSLDGVKAKKGIFITTSGFSREAHEYTSRIDKRIVLIDGERLVHLMYDHDVGVTPVASYPVKRVDQDYFIEE